MRDTVDKENFPGEPEFRFDETDPIEDEPELIPRKLADDLHRTGPTGPTSPEGKAKSSMNRLTHGCRSEKTVLRDEDPAEFDCLVDSWFDQYKPQDADAIMLVQETARAHWFFKRASRRLEQIEWDVPENVWNWTDEHHKLFTNFSRYKTTNQRTFVRLYNELQAHGDRSRHLARAGQHALNEAARLELQWLTKKQEKAAEEVKIAQLVEVEEVNGQCRTSYYPTNQKLLEQVAGCPKPPLFFKRWVSFTGGVPPEYAWVQPDSIQKVTDTIGVQNMSFDDWLELIEREKTARAGHIGPLREPPPASPP